MPTAQLLEESSALPVETAYGRSKQEGESLLSESPLEGVVLRPSHVYGPGGWFEERVPRPPAGAGALRGDRHGRNLWDVVRDVDVATAFGLAVDEAAPGSTYHVVDDEPIAYCDFVAQIAEELGTGPPRRVPAWVARIVAGADPVRRGNPLGAVLQRADQAGAGMGPEFPTAERGIRDAVAAIAS